MAHRRAPALLSHADCSGFPCTFTCPCHATTQPTAPAAVLTYLPRLPKSSRPPRFQKPPSRPSLCARSPLGVLVRSAHPPRCQVSARLLAPARPLCSFDRSVPRSAGTPALPAARGGRARSLYFDPSAHARRSIPPMASVMTLTVLSPHPPRLCQRPPSPFVNHVGRVCVFALRIETFLSDMPINGDDATALTPSPPVTRLLDPDLPSGAYRETKEYQPPRSRPPAVNSTASKMNMRRRLRSVEAPGAASP